MIKTTLKFIGNAAMLSITALGAVAGGALAAACQFKKVSFLGKVLLYSSSLPGGLIVVGSTLGAVTALAACKIGTAAKESLAKSKAIAIREGFCDGPQIDRKSYTRNSVTAEKGKAFASVTNRTRGVKRSSKVKSRRSRRLHTTPVLVACKQ